MRPRTDSKLECVQGKHVGMLLLWIVTHAERVPQDQSPASPESAQPASPHTAYGCNTEWLRLLLPSQPLPSQEAGNSPPESPLHAQEHSIKHSDIVTALWSCLMTF